MKNLKQNIKECLNFPFLYKNKDELKEKVAQKIVQEFQEFLQTEIEVTKEQKAVASINSPDISGIKELITIFANFKVEVLKELIKKVEQQ